MAEPPSPPPGDPWGPSGPPIRPLPGDLASNLRRFGGFVVDGVIIGLIALAVTFPLPDVMAGLVRLGISFCFVALLIGYRGQSIGQQVVRVRVRRIDVDGLPGLDVSVRRWLIPGLLSLLVVVFPVSPARFIVSLVGLAVYLPMFWTPRRQGLHDMLAHTVVVNA